MEKTAEKRAKKEVTKAQWTSAYINYALTEGGRPASVFAFAKTMKAPEADFYAHFNSFEGLERGIWQDWFRDTLQAVERDPAYAEYTVREKLLAFYFTWLETLKQNRSFALKCFEGAELKNLDPDFLADLKASFKEYIRTLIAEGKDTTEIAGRPLSNQYDKAFWMHFLFINRFWLKDDSKGFEKTDAAVEKSIHLALDLVGRGPLDSMIDFAKFLFQNRSSF